MAPSGISNRDIHDGGRYQKAGSRIGRPHFEPQLQQIRLERDQRAIERAAELLDHALGGVHRRLARRRIGQQLAELLHQRFLGVGLPGAAGAIERLVDIGEIEDVRTMNDRRAELDRLDRILPAMGEPAIRP